jgi:phosphoribosyl 1,2-cyclic phosphate phosphodiesterase
MNIQLLGTGAAEGVPGLFCRCGVCGEARKRGGKDFRTRSSALIDGVLKVDFPPDILHQVMQCDLDLRAMESLLFTHTHDDHFAWAELQYLGKYFVTDKPKPLPIFGPRDVICHLDHHLEQDMVPVTLHFLECFETAKVGDYLVTPIAANHDPSQECFNYIIEDQHGHRLLYASDTGWYHEPTWEFLSSVRLDGVLAECAKGECDGGYSGHMCIGDIIRMREKLMHMGTLEPTAPFVTTHFSHMGGLLHDRLEEKFAPHHIQPGFDGMTFQV